jgi:hypothetical protein
MSRASTLLNRCIAKGLALWVMLHLDKLKGVSAVGTACLADSECGPRAYCWQRPLGTCKCNSFIFARNPPICRDYSSVCEGEETRSTDHIDILQITMRCVSLWILTNAFNA